MTRLIIFTQVYENYGAHDWDGQGECPEYWKPKFGNDYSIVVDGADMSNLTADQIREAVNQAKQRIEEHSVHFREYVIGWPQVLEDGELTEFEEMQVLYDGKVDRPIPEIHVSL